MEMEPKYQIETNNGSMEVIFNDSISWKEWIELRSKMDRLLQMGNKRYAARSSQAALGQACV